MTCSSSSSRLLVRALAPLSVDLVAAVPVADDFVAAVPVALW